MVAAVAAGPVAAGCGDDDPSYCSATSDLKADVNKVVDDATSANFAAVQSDVDQVKTQAQTVVDDAKSDFPSETDAVDSAVDELVDQVNALGESPSAEDLFNLATQAGTAVKSVDSLSSAIESKC